jgi:serine/threonine protein phosphatase PrpC
VARRAQHFNDLYALKNAPPQIYMGLFDGHSGKEAAEYCRYLTIHQPRRLKLSAWAGARMSGPPALRTALC